ncbi:MAG: anthranilate phosphoribosyltransferase [Calditrichaceae bacterium]|nr:anthranilate phosphoribosyltransferase [Calditrichaceae bacterium]
MFKDYLEKIAINEHLERKDAGDALEYILKGDLDQAEIGAFLMGMRMKGETADELLGFLDTMEKHMVRVQVNDINAIDVCGTGGDGTHSWNVSTTTAFVAAAGGATVAKHGNRSVSSRSGSADVLEALGIKIDMTPEQTKKCIDTIGIGFLFAPLYHPATKAVVPARKSMKIRTFFNMLGPLLNPAGVKRQIIGTYDTATAKRVAEVLDKKGHIKACTMHSADGFDEISPFDSSYIFEVNIKAGGIREFQFSPPAIKEPERSVPGGDSQANARLIIDILKGKPGVTRQMTVFNSAFALYVADIVSTVGDGIEMAESLLDDGSAYKKLIQFQEFSKQVNGGN